MQMAKREVEQMLRNLPEDSTLEDIRYHLYVLEKIKRGRIVPEVDNPAIR